MDNGFRETSALVERLEREFRERAERWYQLRGDAEKANKEYRKLYEMKGALRLLPDRGEAVLKRIAEVDNPNTQILVAAALFAVDTFHHGAPGTNTG